MEQPTMILSPEERITLRRDYARGEVDRIEAGHYARVHRGSARLVMDLYRTESEEQQHVEKWLRHKLPGQK